MLFKYPWLPANSPQLGHTLASIVPVAVHFFVLADKNGVNYVEVIMISIKRLFDQIMMECLTNLTSVVVWRNLSPMDIFREFLESSTIHGLSYISTSKVNIISYVGIRKNSGFWIHFSNVYVYVCLPCQLVLLACHYVYVLLLCCWDLEDVTVECWWCHFIEGR